MDWEAKEKERSRRVMAERDRLMKMTDAEAESLPVPDRYQRMRYLREIEAAVWLAGIRAEQKLKAQSEPEPIKKRYGGYKSD